MLPGSKNIAFPRCEIQCLFRSRTFLPVFLCFRLYIRTDSINYMQIEREFSLKSQRLHSTVASRAKCNLRLGANILLNVLSKIKAEEYQATLEGTRNIVLKRAKQILLTAVELNRAVNSPRKAGPTVCSLLLVSCS